MTEQQHSIISCKFILGVGPQDRFYTFIIMDNYEENPGETSFRVHTVHFTGVKGAVRSCGLATVTQLQ